jgi:large subunit ribosomal protein L9
MKVVLREEVKGLGAKGDLVEVADGYGRNYLLPKKLALRPEGVNLEAMKRSQKRAVEKKEKEKKELEALAEKIKKVSLTISMKAGSDDKLYGAVNAEHIAEALKREGLDIDKKKIALEEPLKLLGVYNVPLKLSPDLSASLKVWVVKE